MDIKNFQKKTKKQKERKNLKSKMNLKNDLCY